MNTLEICCDSLTSALAAQAGGADRIELCSALSLDGLTPSAGLLAEVNKHLTIPVFVMIRPRGGDFCYTEDELLVMLADIRLAKELGADGIVSGPLAADGRVDVRRTRQLLAAASPLPFTFHKAFDRTPDLLEALSTLKDLGVDRILTSGGAETALAGKALLGQLQDRAGDRLRIMAGGGVRSGNMAELTAMGNLLEFHSSARGKNGHETEAREVAALKALLSEKQ